MGKLKRYGVAITQLEPDLDALLRGEATRMRSELLSQPVVTPDGINFMPAEKAELLAGVEEPDEKSPPTRSNLFSNGNEYASAFDMGSGY